MHRPPLPLSPQALSLLTRFAGIIAVACRAVSEAQRFGLAVPISWAIHRHLQRIGKRFARLAEMALNGTLPPPRKRKPLADGEAPPARKPREKPLIRMAGWAWIVKHAQAAVVAGTRLHALLNEPAMIELMKLDARLPAMIRPLCVALATVPEPGVLPPPVPRARRPGWQPKPPKPKPPPKPRVKKVRWWCAKPPGRGLVFSDPKLNT